MSFQRSVIAVLPLVLAVSVLSPARAVNHQVVRTMPIGGEGDWDSLAVSADGSLLYVPRTTHTQVIEAVTGKVVADIPGQKHCHGVALAPKAHRGFISDGGDGSVVVFDLKTYAVLGKVAVQSGAAGILYDPGSNRILVVSGDTRSLVAFPPRIDLASGKADPPVDLEGQPGCLATDGQGHVYVSITDAGTVADVDMTLMQVAHFFRVGRGSAPVGLAMDPAVRRLYVGCRKPESMVVMDADSGRVLSALPIGAGVETTVFDADSGEAYASCRDGTLTAVHETTPGLFGVAETVTTKPGARTMVLDPHSHAIYLPTAQYDPSADGKKLVLKPGTFMVVVVGPAG